MAKREVTITRGGINVIATGLAQPGWAKTPKDIYVAGKLGVRLDEEFTDVPGVTEGATEAEVVKAHKEHLASSVVLELTDNEYKSVQACLKHHIGQGSLIPTVHTVTLCEALGLVDDEE